MATNLEIQTKMLKVVSLCNEFAEDMRVNDNKRYKKELLPKYQCVYVISDGEYCKIGCSTVGGLKKRIKGIKHGNPREIKVKLLIICRDRYKIETSLHRMFYDKHANGEWFLLTENDLERIRSKHDGAAIDGESLDPIYLL